MAGSRYNELKEYKSKHGDCDVPLNQGPLGLWVSIQRKHKYKLLSKERVQLLNEIGLQSVLYQLSADMIRERWQSSTSLT